MSVKPYPTDEDEKGALMANEPSMHEAIIKRRVNMADVMRHSITLEESRKIMEERIFRFYHSEG